MRYQAVHLSLGVVLASGMIACGDRQPTTPLRTPDPVVRASLNGGAPAPYQFDATVDGLCPFPVRLEGIGKAKALTTGQDQSVTKALAPTQTTRVTNMVNGSQVTLVTTGVITSFVDEDGNNVGVATGSNVLYDPVVGFMYTEGTWSWTWSSDWTTLLTPLHGFGVRSNICEMIE